MPEITAFRGLRYNLGHVGSLSDVIAPPYDVIDPDLQSALYKRHPANVIRLELNRDEPGDDASNNRYTRAAWFFKNWQREGVLQADPLPALYVYHQNFAHGGVDYTRRGFMARVRLQRFGEGNIYPHEETHASAKEDRLKLTRACQANLSQIFGLYPDPANAAQQLLEQQIEGQPGVEAVDHLGVKHRLWAVTDVQTIARVSTLMSGLPMYIADGHHRYETACNYRDELTGQGELPPTHPAHSVLTMCISMTDPGLIVLPTHRLFRGLPEFTCEQLRDRLGQYFTATDAGSGPPHAHEVWRQIESQRDQSLLGLYTARDDRWTLVRLNDAGRTKMAEIAAEHSRDWQGLGVAILHRLIIEAQFGTQLPKPKYVHLVDEVVAGLEHGDDEGGRFPLAALVMPATVEHIRAISEHGERMPAKSTYFYPKLLSGLVFNPLV